MSLDDDGVDVVVSVVVSERGDKRRQQRLTVSPFVRAALRLSLRRLHNVNSIL